MAGVIAGLRALGAGRLAAMAGVALSVLGLLAFLALRAAEPPMGLLYADLDARDAAAVVASLERARVPHRIARDGTQVLVPEDQVARLRLTLAKEGVPAGGGVGYELFDRGESLTTTPFQQDLNRVRALEGELARTIRGLSGVRSARVHLVLPRREAFSRERGEAQASVVLTMQGAQRLDREAVQAVLHLVATAVPGLQPRQVSIVDSRGELLARGGQAVAAPGSAGGAQALEELRRAEGLRLSRAVEEMLERSLGPGRVRAEATVEMDFDRVQTTEERFDAENQVPRSQQSVTESNRGVEPAPVTVAGNLPNADPAAAGGGGSQESRQEETTNFEIGKSVRSIVREHPVVRRLSVAVLVDGVSEAQEGAAPRWRERTPDELARLAALVRGAVGFDERRGDTVEVVSLRLADPALGGGGEETAAGFLGLRLTAGLVSRLTESALIAVVALAGLLLVARPMANRLVATLVPVPAAVAGSADGAATLAAGAGAGDDAAALAGPGAGSGVGGGAALAGPDGTAPALAGPAEGALVEVAGVAGALRVSSLQRLAALVEAHPDEALDVVRRWMAEPAGSEG